jgi:hypothetical protein
MNPQAHDEADRRKANERPEEGSDPIGDGVRRSADKGSRCTILQQGLDITIEQSGTGGPTEVVTHCHSLALEITNELVGVGLSREVFLVAFRVRSPSDRI